MRLEKPAPAQPRSPTGRRIFKIWQAIHEWRPPKHARDFGQYIEKRALTKAEWETVQKTVLRGYPATIVPHGWIDGCALVLYEVQPPLYPGAEELVTPIPIIQIPTTQLPGNSRDKGKYAIDPSVARPTPGGAWDLFTRICNTTENLALLTREKIDPPKTIGHYQY